MADITGLRVFRKNVRISLFDKVYYCLWISFKSGSYNIKQMMEQGNNFSTIIIPLKFDTAHCRVDSKDIDYSPVNMLNM